MKFIVILGLFLSVRSYAESTWELHQQYFNSIKESVIESRDNGELEGKSVNRVFRGMLRLYGLDTGCKNENIEVINWGQCAWEYSKGSFNPNPDGKTYRSPEGGGGWSRAGDMIIGAAGSKIIDRVGDKIYDKAEQAVNRGADRLRERIERERQDNERAKAERDRKAEHYRQHCDYNGSSFRGGDC